MATALQDHPAPNQFADSMNAMGRRARAAAAILATVPRILKDEALEAAARTMRGRVPAIIAANREDLAAGEAKGLTRAMLDRLTLDAQRIEGIAASLEAIAELGDPVGQEIARWQRPNGLDIARVRTPLGVVGVIYESRPNVTADAGGLCLKAGNAVILRGGSECLHSARAIHACLAEGLETAGLPVDAIQLVPTADRAAVGHMLAMAEHIDVIVPRGGRSLIERVQAEARMPVFAHLDGLCHVYLHAAAEPAMARAIAVNAKMRRTGICGAMETLLCDSAVAQTLLPPIIDDLVTAGCEVRGDPGVRALDSRVVAAEEADWRTEYLDAILAIKLVDGLEQAIAHIEAYGSHHTDSIVTADETAAAAFLERVDSAIVMHNASTQFADGGEFGMGAEIGISTGRMHARGPVGVEQLTSFKYVVRGTGQTRPG